MTEPPSEARVRALAIEDEPEDRTTIERLSTYGVDCRAIPPPKATDFTDLVFAPIERAEIDLVLLDYRLDDRSTPEEGPASYRGGMLAAAIREHHPDMPIVLVTTEEKRREYVEGNPSVRGLSDHVLLKSAIGGRPNARQAAAKEIVDLALGFRTIRGVMSDATGEQVAARLLRIDADELGSFTETVAGAIPNTVAGLAGWLLREILPYPGPLLDSGEASARLGLTRDSFGAVAVQQWAEPARYSGPFMRLHPRWWERRLPRRLEEVAGEDAYGDSKTRAASIARQTCEEGLEAALCTYCNQGLVQRTCRVCGGAVDATHQLAVRVDARPSWALPAIVCFRCIEIGRDEEVPGLHYGPGTHSLIDQLKRRG